MSLSVHIAMFGWIPLVLALFVLLPARRAVLAGFLVGSMFLPMAAYPVAGFPDYTKTFAICVGVAVSVALFDFRALLRLRPTWLDAPILLFCISPFFSSIRGGLGMHEGLSVLFNQAITWGIPYALGVLYFRSLSGLRELAVGLFAGGLIYVPLCVYEIINSPKLHLMIYGFAQGDIDSAAMRFGGWRPMVFMTSGLMVALWMAVASVLGIWLYRAGLLPSIAGIRPVWFVAVLVLTTLWLKSVNGWFLLLLGATVLMASSLWRSRALVWLLPVVIVACVMASATGVWSREQVIPLVEAVVNENRAQSVSYRLRNEEVIASNARERPLLGWGRTVEAFADRNRTINPYGDPSRPSYAVVDSLWIGVFAMFGAVGLAGLLGSTLLPPALFVWRFPPAHWREAETAPAAALAVILLMYAVDNLANGFINPVFMLAAGGLMRCSAEREV